MLAPWRFVVRFVFVLGWIFFAFLLALIAMVSLFFYNLPNLSDQSFLSIKNMASDQLKNRNIKNHKWTAIKDINRDLIYTVVLAEDSKFFDHKGVDYDAIKHAVLENIKKDKKSYGASTITQQVVKNIFLDSTKSYKRKLEEIVLANRLEKLLTKNEILEIYLNIVELGADIYGVNSASGYYFKKRPSAINASEGAYMALMLTSPRKNSYILYQNRNITPEFRKKYNNILFAMRAKGYITQVQLENYKKQINSPNWPPK